ncbi:MAG TPA: non-canonical purine NTP pyrophosphatase [Acidobacteriaceae bacterium]|nr:non-canonical purine NTP pyrophosphatase [Acidobacteriaceae bacterium]
MASSNAGKLRDFAAAAAVFKVEIAVLPGLTEIAAPVEDGSSFEANARLKAEAYSRARPGLLVIADDSGLEVDALGGAPGVRSARYAEDADFDATDSEDADGRNNLYLLGQLRGHPRPWTARYRCVLALARDGVVLMTAAGAVEGEIIAEPHGTGGFGYDPLFWLAELGKTMAEIDLGTKQRLSHRGRALKALLDEMRGQGC